MFVRSLLYSFSLFLFVSLGFASLLSFHSDPVRAQEANRSILDEVVVSAQRLPGSSIERNVLGGRVEVIGTEEIQRESSRTLAEFLGSLPGFVLRDQGGNEFDQVLSARGFANGEDVLLNVDGIRLNKFGNNGVDWQALPDLSAIQRIEIIYGPGSSTYGEGAQSAVINIITKKKQASTRVEYSGGSFAHNEGKVSGGFEWRDWQGFVQGRAVDRHGFRTNADANIQNVLVNLTKDWDDDKRLRIQGMVNRSNVGAPNAITDTEIRQNGYEFTPTANRDDFREVEHDLVKISYEDTLFERLGMELQLSYQNRKSLFESTSRVFGSESVTNADQTVKGLQWVFQRRQDWNGIIHNLSGGFEFNDTEQDRRSFGGRDEKETQSFFVQDRVQISKKLTVSGGVRLDYTDMFIQNKNSGASFHREFDPESMRAGFSYRVTPRWTWFGQYGEAFMPPNFGDILAFDGPFSSNLDIKPEESEQWELGLRGGGADYDWTINYFHVDTDNEIRLNTTTFKNENLAQTEREGFELNGTYRFSPDFSLSGMITTFDATITGNPNSPATVGKTIPMVPDYRASWESRYQLSKDAKVSLQGLYVDEQVVASDNDNDEPTLPSYDVWNLFATWNFSPSATLQLTVKNLLDEEYSTRGIESGSTFGAFPPGTIFFSPSPDRHAELSLTYQF